MAAKKRQPAATPPPDDELDELEVAATGPALDSVGIENLLNQLGELHGEAKVHVYRVRQGVRPPFAFLFATTAGQFDVEDVSARYGGGDFFVRAWQRGVSGSLVNERFAIEGDPRHPYTAPAAPNQAAAPGAPIFYPSGNNDAVAQLGAMFQNSMQQIAQLVAGSQRKERTLEETLQLFAMFKSISGGGDQLGMLKEIMGIMREAQPLTGEDGRADAWSVLQTAAEKILPAIMQASGANRQAPPQLLGPTGAPINPSLVSGAPLNAPGAPPVATTIGDAVRFSDPSAGAPRPPTQAPGVNMSSIPPQLGLFIGALVNAARINAQPGEYAQYLMDQIEATPRIEPAVRAYLNAPDWFAQLVAANPEARGFEPWFTTLRAEVMGALDAPPDGDENDDELTPGEGDGISGLEEPTYAPGHGRH